MKPIKTWILIADGARARILLNEGPGHGLTNLPDAVFETSHAPSRDIDADRHGRSFESTGSKRHAMSPKTDGHRRQKILFASRLSDYLAKALDRSAFDRLIIVAAPVTLGDLRAKISDRVLETVSGEIAKDLTAIPVRDLDSYLTDVIAL